MAGEGILYIVAILFLVFLAVLWVLLPFAVFGTKDKLNQMIDIGKKITTNLDLLLIEMRSLKKTDKSIEKKAENEN